MPLAVIFSCKRLETVTRRHDTVPLKPLVCFLLVLRVLRADLSVRGTPVIVIRHCIRRKLYLLFLLFIIDLKYGYTFIGK